MLENINAIATEDIQSYQKVYGIYHHLSSVMHAYNMFSNYRSSLFFELKIKVMIRKILERKNSSL